MRPPRRAGRPFDDAPDINVRPREVAILNFMPEETGEYEIKHELHGFTGEIIVE